MKSSIELITTHISEKIEIEIKKLGIQYRIFSRSKDLNSIKEKIDRRILDGDPYKLDGKMMQDLFGVRIVTYFQDDISIVKSVIEKRFEVVDQAIDDPQVTVFKPKRTNIICNLLSEENELFNEFVNKNYIEEYKLVAPTFELQLRTILSEGWHEIDHNLRYKCKEDWRDHSEEERMLNGIYASLETNDTALKSLFNELSYQHFKAKQWEAMLRTKFRIRFKLGRLDSSLVKLFDSNPKIGKSIVKLNRNEALLELYKFNGNIPLTITNFVYMINFSVLKCEKIMDLVQHELGTLLNDFYEE